MGLWCPVYLCDIFNSTMKYNEVTTLVNGGILGLSSHALSVSSAYAVTKFKREIQRLYDEWMGKYKILPAEAGIDNPEAFDKRRAALTEKLQESPMSIEETRELDGLNEKFGRLQGLRGELAEDVVTIKCTPLPYEDWYNLKNENKSLKIGNAELLELAETSLEGILWIPPSEPA